MTLAKIDAINMGITREYLFSAAQYLKTKIFMKPKKLARYLGISRHRAARVLRVLEWEIISDLSQCFNPTFVRKGGGWNDE